MRDHSILPTVKNLESLFSIFNQKYYDGQLHPAVITISPDNSRKRTRKTLGWCTSWKSWKNPADDSASDNNASGYYEINICADYLNSNFVEICKVMLHEMAHLWNLQNNIQDTSRNGTYHNKHFKQTAERHGLTVKRDDTYGWADTRLRPETKQFIENMESFEFVLYRTIQPAGRKPSAQSTRKYICPDCGTIIRATKEVDVTCSICNVRFRKMEVNTWKK